MAFEKLFHQPATELELINMVTAEVQSRFEELRGGFYFLKVDLVNLEQSQIVWEKLLPSREALWENYFDTKNYRCFLAMRFEKDRFEVLTVGFSVLARFQIFPDWVKSQFLEIHKCDSNKENHPMISKELMEGGFGDLTGQFKAKLPKAI